MMPPISAHATRLCKSGSPFDETRKLFDFIALQRGIKFTYAKSVVLSGGPDAGRPEISGHFQSWLSWLS
jgi:hypothetical protein